MSRVIFFRCDITTYTGLGHYTRCLALADEMWANAVKPIFIIGGDSLAASILQNQSYEYHLQVPGLSMSAGFARPRKCASVGIVLDLSYQRNVAERSAFAPFLDNLDSAFGKRIVIDGAGNDSLVPQMGESVELLVVPYEGAVVPRVFSPNAVLVGPQYYPLPTSLLRVARTKRVRREVAHLLVTFGGSDPWGLTEQFVDSAPIMRNRPQTRIIIGPCFGSDRVSKLDEIVRNLDHCQLVVSPPSMWEHYCWADMAVTATGLTKYELAYAGVPSVHVSGDQAARETNKTFSERLSIADLGPLSCQTDFAQRMDTGIEDYGYRKRVFVRGKELLDGRGSQRIVARIM